MKRFQDGRLDTSGNAEYEFSYKVESVDVQKTDSLITPYIGYLILHERLDTRTDKNWTRFPIRATLAWQNGRWIGKRLEQKLPTGWDPTDEVVHPKNRLLMRVIPVEWDQIGKFLAITFITDNLGEGLISNREPKTIAPFSLYEAV